MHQSEQSRSIPSLIREKRHSVLRTKVENPFFDIASEQEGNILALKITNSIGEQRAIHYHDLVSPMDYNGENQITLLTPRIKIAIYGQNLDDLFDYIIQHRVKWIKEPQESFQQVREKEAEIIEIRFELIQ